MAAVDLWEDWCVDYLILLVGSNPLPNAVAGTLLFDAAKAGKIYLVHTRETGFIAKNLASFFGEDHCELRSLTDLYSHTVYGAVKTILTAEDPEHPTQFAIPDGRRVGLHYTGGTKSMSVHAFRSFEHADTTTRALKLSCTYLDARTLQMCRDEGTPLGTAPVSRKRVLPRDFSLDLLDLLTLHGRAPERWLVRDNRPISALTSPGLAQTAQQFAEVFVKPAPMMWWKEWVIKLEKAYKGAKWKYRKATSAQATAPSAQTEQELAEATRDLEAAEKVYLGTALGQAELQSMLSTLWREMNLAEIGTLRAASFIQLSQLSMRAYSLHSTTARDRGWKDEAMEWLKGKWLESVVLQCLQHNHPVLPLSLTDCTRGLRIQEETRKINEVEVRFAPFEVDGLAMCGHQLFVFSCSTNTEPGNLKRKLFEAIQRAQQLGGDEARAALVCPPINYNQDLEAEIRSDFGVYGDSQQFTIFPLHAPTVPGITTVWEQLAHDIRTWIFRESHQDTIVSGTSV